MSQTPIQGAQAISTAAQTGAIASASSSAKSSIEASEATGRSTAESIVKIYNHQVDGKPAATLYVRNLPILTSFVVTTESSPTATTPAAQPVSDTAAVQKSAQLNNSTSLSQVEAIANQIDQMHHDGVDVDGLKVVWQGDQKTGKGQYVIKFDKQAITTVDQNTTYAKTTSSAEQDALLIANRLRRLLSDGEVEPLKTVEGKPKPKPVVAARRSHSSAQSVVGVYRGQASWYGPGFHGNRTANGERFNQYALTAAHPYLAFGTQVRVTNNYTGRSVVVRINDRGPYSGGRIIDLSAGAAEAIGLKSSGVGPVSVEVLR